MTMPITTGIKKGAEKVIIYGTHGIGKSTLAAQFPDPVFCDVEDSTSHMDVPRTPTPTSWPHLFKVVSALTQDHQGFKTAVFETADWIERLCTENLCVKHEVDGIEGFGYGKGFKYLREEFGRFLDALTELHKSGMHVVLTAHAETRKIEQPDERGAYDRWEMKLDKKTGAMAQEWAYLVLFLNYEIFVVEDDKTKSKKASGGKRVIHTEYHPCWDAKQREAHNLPPKLPLDYAKIAHLFDGLEGTPQPATATSPAPEPKPKPEEPQAPAMSKVERQLRDLMAASNVEDEEILRVVALKGWFPEGTELKTIIDNGFVEKNLIPNWDKCVKLIEKEVRASV